jgi:hypothetical protein
VLALFEPLIVDELPKDASNIGSFHITADGGAKVVISIYHTGKEPLRFSINDVPCVRAGPYQKIDGYKYFDEAVLVFELVHGLYWESAFHKEPPGVKRALETFMASAGKLGTKQEK